MRKPAIIGFLGFAVIIASIIPIAYWISTGTFGENDYELFPVIALLIGIYLPIAGAIWNYIEYKQGKIKSYWGQGWDFGA